MVAAIDEALRLRDQGVGEICVGEAIGMKEWTIQNSWA